MQCVPTSGMDKSGSAVDILEMKLKSKIINSLRVKTQLLIRQALVCDRHHQIHLLQTAPTQRSQHFPR